MHVSTLSDLLFVLVMLLMTPWVWHIRCKTTHSHIYLSTNCMVPILLSYMDKPLDKYTEYEMQILVHHLICYVLVMTIQVRHVEAICKDPFFHPFTGGNRAMVANPNPNPNGRGRRWAHFNISIGVPWQSSQCLIFCTRYIVCRRKKPCNHRWCRCRPYFSGYST